MSVIVRPHTLQKPPPGSCLYRGHPFCQDLAGAWAFLEGSGLTTRDLVQDLPAVFSGTTLPNWTADRTIHFNGTGSVLSSYLNVVQPPRVNDLVLTNGFSLIFRIKSDLSNNNNFGFFNKSDNNTGAGNQGWQYSQVGGFSSFTIQRSISNYTATLGTGTLFATDGNWHTVCITFDGINLGDTLFYLDGNFVGSHIGLAGAGTLGSDITRDLIIGSGTSGLGGGLGVSFIGAYDFVYLWKNRCLNNQEILSLAKDPYQIIQTGPRFFFTQSIINIGESLSDSISLSDSDALTRGLILVDTLSISDSQKVVSNLLLDIEGDVLALSDIDREVLNLLESFSDSLDIEDNLDNVIAGINLALSETIVLSDHLDAPATITLGINDTLSLSDNIDLLLPVTFVFNDTVTLSDQLDTFAPYSLLVVDSLFLSDNISLSGNGIPITFSEADTLILSDIISFIVDCKEIISDTINLSDSTTVAGQDLLNLTDSLSLTDHINGPVARIEISIGLSFSRSSGGLTSDTTAVPNEGILLSDNINISYGLHFDDISDELILNDSIALSLITIDPQVSDFFTLSDSVQIQLAVTQLLVSDSLVLSDAITVLVAANITRNVTDILNLSDAVSTAQFTDFIDYVRRYLNDVPCDSNVGS